MRPLKRRNGVSERGPWSAPGDTPRARRTAGSESHANGLPKPGPRANPKAITPALSLSCIAGVFRRRERGQVAKTYGQNCDPESFMDHDPSSGLVFARLQPPPARCVLDIHACEPRHPGMASAHRSMRAGSRRPASKTPKPKRCATRLRKAWPPGPISHLVYESTASFDNLFPGPLHRRGAACYKPG